MGYEPKLVSFQTEQGKTLRNIEIVIPGTVDSTVIIGAHYDGAVQSRGFSHYPAAEDNGSGTVTLLMTLKRIKDNPLNTEKKVLCCFWDSEEVNEGKAFRESEHFVNELTEE